MLFMLNSTFNMIKDVQPPPPLVLSLVLTSLLHKKMIDLAPNPGSRKTAPDLSKCVLVRVIFAYVDVLLICCFHRNLNMLTLSTRFLI